MDRNTLLLVGLVVFGVVVIVAVIFFRKKAKFGASITGPGGMGVNVQAEDRDTIHRKGARQKNIDARQGAVADDHTGEGASQEHVKTEGKATARSFGPGDTGSSKKV